MAKAEESFQEVRDRLESKFTVVHDDNVKRTKYAQSPRFTGFSREHAAMLAASVDSCPSFTPVPLALQRWAQATEECPHDPLMAWQEWLIALQDGRAPREDV